MDLIVPKNSAEVMQVLRKEVQKTQGEEGEKNAEVCALALGAEARGSGGRAGRKRAVVRLNRSSAG